jgi:hypothetical protein
MVRGLRLRLGSPEFRFEYVRYECGHDVSLDRDTTVLGWLALNDNMSILHANEFS